MSSTSNFTAKIEELKVRNQIQLSKFQSPTQDIPQNSVRSSSIRHNADNDDHHHEHDENSTVDLSELQSLRKSIDSLEEKHFETLERYQLLLKRNQQLETTLITTRRQKKLVEQKYRGTRRKQKQYEVDSRQLQETLTLCERMAIDNTNMTKKMEQLQLDVYEKDLLLNKQSNRLMDMSMKLEQVKHLELTSYQSFQSENLRLKSQLKELQQKLLLVQQHPQKQEALQHKKEVYSDHPGINFESDKFRLSSDNESGRKAKSTLTSSTVTDESNDQIEAPNKATRIEVISHINATPSATQGGVSSVETPCAEPDVLNVSSSPLLEEEGDLVGTPFDGDEHNYESTNPIGSDNGDMEARHLQQKHLNNEHSRHLDDEHEPLTNARSTSVDAVTRNRSDSMFSLSTMDSTDRYFWGQHQKEQEQQESAVHDPPTAPGQTVEQDPTVPLSTTGEDDLR